jgi:hypothetical protein
MLLLESGFLALFLSMATKPGIWLLRCLLFRFMFLSGSVKLLSGDPRWANLSALYYHPLAWYAHHLPRNVLKASTVEIFVIELGLPFLIFCPRRLRFVAASVPTCATMRFKWDRADLVSGCPHSRSEGCGHKFGSVNPPPCGFHATAIAVARAERNRCAALLEVMGMALDALLSGQEIDELDAFLASEARPQERMDITASTAFSPRWRSAPIFRFRADGRQSPGVARVPRSSSRLNRRTE